MYFMLRVLLIIIIIDKKEKKEITILKCSHEKKNIKLKV